MRNLKQEIQDQINNHKVVLYMKGNPRFPMCGFSAKVVKILTLCEIKDFFSINILEDEEMRQAIKEFANWPTIPQLYVNGEFIGGSDIVGELFESGELQQLLAK